MQTGGSARVLALDIKRPFDVPGSARAVGPFGSLAPPNMGGGTMQTGRWALQPSRSVICHLSFSDQLIRRNRQVANPFSGCVIDCVRDGCRCTDNADFAQAPGTIIGHVRIWDI
jgi:hypothetical protein